MKVLIDMNLSPRWVSHLEGEGIEASHWSALGAANATDSQIMAFARAHDWIVLTHDLDFGAILAATRGISPSVVQIRAEDVSPIAIGAKVVAALKQMKSELAVGALLTIDAARARMSVLPLEPRD